MKENRQHIRISKSLMVSFRVISQLLGDGTRSKNISAGGICLPTDQKLAPGTMLELEFALAENNKPIKTTGQVIWSVKKENSRFLFEMGIRFIKVNPPDRNAIIDYISKENPSEIKWID